MTYWLQLGVATEGLRGWLVIRIVWYCRNVGNIMGKWDSDCSHQVSHFFLSMSLVVPGEIVLIENINHYPGAFSNYILYEFDQY